MNSTQLLALFIDEGKDEEAYIKKHGVARLDILKRLAKTTLEREARIKDETEKNGQDKVAELAESIKNKYKEGDSKTPDAYLAAQCAEMVHALTTHYFEPAFTAHPTNPADIESEKAIGTLRDILYNHTTIVGDKAIIAEDKQDDFKKALTAFHEHPVVAEDKLTVRQEIERNNHIFKTVLTQFADMKNYITDSILKANRITDRKSFAYKRAYVKVSNAIAEGVVQSFSHMHFWSGTDADGNKNVCPNTMELSLEIQRQTLLAFYQSQVKFLGQRGIDISGIQEALTAYQKALVIDGSLLDSATVEENRQAIVEAIQKARRKFYGDRLKVKVSDNDLETYTAIRNLEDLVKHVGLEGPALDVRQTTKTTHPAMGYFIARLPTDTGTQGEAIGRLKAEHARLVGKDTSIAASNAAWQEILGPRTDAIGKDAQAVLNALRMEEFYKNKLAEIYGELFTEDKKEELASAKAEIKDGEGVDIAAFREVLRFQFLAEYPVGDRYRISDCKTANDVVIARIFENTARKRLEQQKITPNEKRLSIIPLAETQDDIERLPETIDQMLEHKLYENNEIILFPGYSDAEKRMGLVGLAVIQQAMFDTIERVRLHNLNLVLKELVGNKNVAEFKEQFLAAGATGLTLEDMQKIDTQSDEYQNLINDPEVQRLLAEEGIKVSISHGEGSDILRGGNMKSHHDSTRQGIEAADSLDPEHNARLLRHMMGIEDNYEHTALYDIKTVNQDEDLNTTFAAFKYASVKGHRDMVTHDKKERYKVQKDEDEIVIHGRGDYVRDALDEVGLGFVVDGSNRSSRAKTKNPFGEFNFEDGRAIGVALKLRSSSTGADLMGVGSLEDIGARIFQKDNSNTDKRLVVADLMNKLAQNSSVTQEILYKTLALGLNTDFNRPYLVSGLNRPYLVSGLNRPAPEDLQKFAQAYDDFDGTGTLTTAQILAKMELHSFQAVAMALCSLAPENKRPQILEIFYEGDHGIGAPAKDRSIQACVAEVQKLKDIDIPLLNEYVEDSKHKAEVRQAITETIKALFKWVKPNNNNNNNNNNEKIIELMEEFNKLPKSKNLPFEPKQATNLQKLSFIYSHVLKKGAVLQHQSKSVKNAEVITKGVDDLIYLFREEQRMSENLLKFEAQDLGSNERLKNQPLTSAASLKPREPKNAVVAVLESRKKDYTLTKDQLEAFTSEDSDKAIELVKKRKTKGSKQVPHLSR